MSGSRGAPRAERLAGVLRRELAVRLRALKDPRVGELTVTDVEVSRDGSVAKVYFMTLDPAHASEALVGLKNAAGYLRRELHRDMHVRHVPELRFFYDESADRGERIDMLLRGLNTDGA